MLHSLLLKNFRKHRDLNLTFSPGLNIVHGANWSGKTTILSAISYALFGSKAVPGTAAGLTTNGESTMWVELSFSIEDDRYKVGRGPNKAELLLEGEKAPIATGQQPVTAEVENLFGVACSDFLDFFITRQEDVFSLLSLGSSKLAGYVGRVTGMDVIDRLLEEAKKHRYLAEGAMSVTSVEKETLQTLKEGVQESRNTYNVLLSDMEFLREQLRTQRATYEKKAKEFQEAELKLKESEQAAHAMAVAKAILASRKETLEQAEKNLPEDKSDLYKDLNRQLQALKDKKVERTAWEKESARLQEELKKAKETLDTIKAQLKSLPKQDPSPAGEKYQNCSKQLEVLSAERTLAEKALEESICPYCNRPFENTDQGALEKNFKKINAAFLAMEKETNRLHDEWSEQKDRMLQRRQLEDSKKQWEDYARPLREAKRILVEPAVKDFSALPDLEKKASELKPLVEDRAIKLAALDKAEKEVIAAKEAVRALPKLSGPTKGEVEKLRNALTPLHESLQKDFLRFSRLEDEGKRLHAKMKTDLKQLEDLEARLAEYEKAEKRKLLLEELAAFIRANRNDFTASFWISLLEHSSNFVREATGNAVGSLIRARDGAFLYEENGVFLPVEGGASGMQKAIFSTALKLSLAQALGSKLNVLFFDEITAAANEEISLLLTSLLAQLENQVVLVSHRQADAAVASNLIAL